MKKVSTLFAVAIVLSLALSSCTRKHTCVCSYVDPVSNQTITTEHIIKGKRKLAASLDCAAYEANYWYLDTYVYCVLK